MVDVLKTRIYNGVVVIRSSLRVPSGPRPHGYLFYRNSYSFGHRLYPLRDLDTTGYLGRPYDPYNRRTRRVVSSATGTRRCLMSFKRVTLPFYLKIQPK